MITATIKVKLNDGQGHVDCELDVFGDSAHLTWIGNGGEEIRIETLTLEEALRQIANVASS